MAGLEPFLKKRGSVDPKTKAGAFFGRSEGKGDPEWTVGVAVADVDLIPHAFSAATILTHLHDLLRGAAQTT